MTTAVETSFNLSAPDAFNFSNLAAANNNVITVAVGTTAVEINSIISSAPAGSTILFDAGIHVLTDQINITRSDISIKGAGGNLTTLKFDLPPGKEGNFINIGDATKTLVGATTSDAAAGSKSITMSDGHSLKPGDHIYIQVPNTQEYLTANGWTNVSMTEAADRPFREFITTVTAVEGNIVTFADALPYTFTSGATQVSTIHMLDHVSLSDFTVTSSLGTANPYSFTNTQAAYSGASAIYATGTDGLSVSHVNIIDSPSSGMTLSSSINATISDIAVQGSHDKGGGGNGYGILLSESFNNNLSGLTILDMRHAVIFSAWSAETGNNIQVDFTNRDVNFHGSPDVGNTVSVTRAELDYNLGVDPSVWSLVSGGGTNHAATKVYPNNTVKFAWAEGHNKSDTLYGLDSGAYLNGHGGNDTLIGGAGNDVIVGGLRRDTMTGGNGSDLFILKTGDDLDTITDFKFGVGGDKIAFLGSSVANGWASLKFTQVGADVYVRYGSNSTVILKDHVIADINAANFVFDTTGSQFGDLWAGL